MTFLANASTLVAGSTSSSSSPSPSFSSFSSGKTVAWWKENSSSPSPYTHAEVAVPLSRYGGLQRSMAIGRKRGAEIARRWSESKGIVYV
ncbi:hypothetical protein EYR40_004975 [Pleurotus pulmonarius]|nr:hypothetical protein EYR40_004975 [Pleurotus pulmonarius]